MWLDDFRNLVTAGEVIDLGQTLDAHTPHHPNHPPFMFCLTKEHGDVVYSENVSASNDIVTMGTHIGSHIDGLGHIAKDGRIYGDRPVENVQSKQGGLREVGVETIPPIITRGVLLDVAAHQGVAALPAGYTIPVSELQEVASAQGVDLRPGDCLLIRTGWIRHWRESRKYVGMGEGSPGPGVEAAIWLAGKGMRFTGSDTLSYERLPAPTLPVHVELLVRRGIYIMEALNLEEIGARQIYEFIFVALPLKIAGATGSPIRPIALY